VHRNRFQEPDQNFRRESLKFRSFSNVLETCFFAVTSRHHREPIPSTGQLRYAPAVFIFGRILCTDIIDVENTRFVFILVFHNDSDGDLPSRTSSIMTADNSIPTKSSGFVSRNAKRKSHSSGPSTFFRFALHYPTTATATADTTARQRI